MMKLDKRLAAFGAAAVDPATGDYGGAGQLTELWAGVLDAVGSGKQTRGRGLVLESGTVQVFARKNDVLTRATRFRELHGPKRELTIAGPPMYDETNRFMVFTCKTGLTGQ